MLQAPMDYSLDVIDPFAAGLAGFQMGQQNRMAEQNQQVSLADASQRQAMNAQGMVMNDQSMAMNAQNMAQGATTFDQGQQDRASEQQRQQAFAVDQSALVGKFQSGAVTAADIAQFSAKYPELADGMKSSFEGLSADRRKNDALELAKAAAALKAGKPEVAIKMLEDRAVAAENAGLTADAGMARAMIEQIKLDPAIGLTVAGLALHQLDPEGAKLVFGEGQDAPADVRTLQWRAEQAGLIPGTPEYKAFIADNGGDGEGKPSSFRALELQAQEAGLIKGTPEYQQFMLTKGAGDVAQAAVQGKAEGENVTQLASMQAKLPGLELVVTDLNALADQATYTAVGLAMDETLKQLGRDPRPEAIARAEYIAMVDNQVLPLLRDTFGAAFTEKEGQTLKNTLGDPAKSPAEKKAVLRAFIAQKKRDVEDLQTQVTKADGSGLPPAADQAQGSVEDDLAKYGAPAP